MSSCCSTGMMKVARVLKLTDKVVNYTAFIPPKKKTYCFKELTEIKQKSADKGDRIKKYAFVHEIIKTVDYPWITVNGFFAKNSLTKKKLALIQIKNKNSGVNPITVLFSHGNCSDLGVIYPLLIDLSSQLKVNVVSYDYSGYGLSEGKPTENKIYEDIRTIITFMNIELNIPNNKIILLGHSLGSAPTINLAADAKSKEFYSVILLSPIASGLRIFNKNLILERNEETAKIDVFPNFIKISEINCPIFIIHGKKDELIPVQQVIDMAKSVKTLYQWYPSKGTHKNILSLYRHKFYSKCRLFFDYLKFFQQPQDLDKTYTTKNISIRYEEKFIENDLPKYHNAYYSQPRVFRCSTQIPSDEANGSECVSSHDLGNSGKIFLKLPTIRSDRENRESVFVDEKKSGYGVNCNTSEVEQEYIRFKTKMASLD